MSKMTANMMIISFIASALSLALLPVCLSSAELTGKGSKLVAKDKPFDDEEVGSEESNELPFNSKDQGWSEWSAWSSCSRSCNGGVSHQIRKCERKSGCEGETTKYKICNMQACPDPQDFRAAQCAVYNPIPYRGRLYEWLPYQDPEDPCSLTCHAKSYSFVAKLASSVKDGTRCREGSLDMCVQGKCLPVGCDLQLGSEKKVDECGVCGGDGSSCRRLVYVWGKTPFSPCSVSCGKGYQMSRPTCLNKANEKEVDERLCDIAARPLPEIKECNSHKCPPVWVTDSWSPCSASCGGGRQSRQVHCAQMGSDGVWIPVVSNQCLRQKPLTERPCNLVPCPQWVSGPWSGCSVTCGKGQKIRSVACKDAKGQHSEDCDVEIMPITKQDCDSGLVCTSSEDPGTYLFSDIFKGSQEDAPPRQPYWSSWPKKITDVSIEPSYVVGEWGPCSTTCGQGFRNRTVNCKIFLEFSRTIATIHDYECPGTKPVSIESCYPRPCSFDLNKPEDRKKYKSHVGIEVTYSWRSNGFTPCSATCKAGTQESIIQCVRDHDQAVVKATQCDITKKPEAKTQFCNDHPCPPRWNISDFSPCSKPCGGGEMTRKVQCIHEVLRGPASTLVVSNDNCPQPPPLEKQFCNVFECPSRWKVDPWSKCSKSCGGGEKVRKIRCMKEKAFGQVVELAPSQCSKHRPKTQKVCNTKPCPSENDIVTSHFYVQQQPLKTVFLKVGGKAVVFAGTNLKIRCPSRNSNKTSIVWYKDNEQIESSKRLKVSMKGALRIRKASLKDSGKYTCVFGFSKEDIFITVKHLPQIQPPKLDEERTVENLLPTFTGTKDRTPEERHSHEKSRPVNPPEIKPPNPTVTNNRNKVAHKPTKIDLGNSVEDTIEDNRPEFHYKPNLNTNVNQGSHQDFNNKEKTYSTEDTIFEFSTLERIPLYIQARNTVKPPADLIPTVKPVDSDEFVPHRGHNNPDKDKQKLKSKTYGGTTSEEKLPNQVLPPPRYGDTWKQTYDGALRAKNKYKEVQFDRNDLVSDQEELNVGTPHGGKGFPGSVESGAGSIHGPSHIKNLLRNLPSLGTTRGDYAGQDSDLDRESGDASHEENSIFPNPTRMVANSFVLGKGKAENLEFDWVISDWSPCSQSCGASGYQVRSSQCLVRLNNVSKPVDSSLCEDAGLAVPTNLQSCGYEDCPHWETAPWSQCLESQCFTWHTSYEKRAIFCRSNNGTDLPLSHCDEKTRPRRKRECYNSKCRSTWRVGEWSECTATCSRQGFQSRILQCVWYGSTRPAGNACRDQQRPIVMRPCKGPPCQSNGNCTDRSSYCSLAKTLHLCRLSRYHLQCCESCRTRESKG